MNNKKMFKVVSLIISALMLALSVLGCGSKSVGTQQDNSSQPIQKSKVTFWFSYNKTVLPELIEKYNKENKDGIELELVVKSSKYPDAIKLAIAAGEAPDLFIVQESIFKQLVQNKDLEDLTGYITPEVKSKFIEGTFIKNLNVIDGKIYCMPSYVATRKLAYNSDLFKKAGLDPQKPPKTIAELKEYAKKITDVGQGKQYGLSMSFGMENIGVRHSTGLIGTRSTGVFDGFDFKKGEFDFTVYKPVLETMHSMMKENIMFPGSTTLKVEQELVQFCAGNIGMAVIASGQAAKLGKGELSTDFEIKLADVPGFDGTPKGKYILEAYPGYGMSSQSKNKKQAFKVLEWIESQEISGAMLAGGSDYHIYNKNVYGNTKYEPTDALVKAFQPTKDYAIYPVVPGGLVVEGDTRDKIFVDIIQTGKDIDSKLKDLTVRYNKALQKTYADGVNKKEDCQIKDFDASKLK